MGRFCYFTAGVLTYCQFASIEVFMRLSRLTQAVAVVTAALILTACGSDSDTATAIIDGTPPLLTTDSNFTDGYSAVAAVFVSGQV